MSDTLGQRYLFATHVADQSIKKDQHSNTKENKEY